MAINKKTAEDILKKRTLNGVNGINVTFKELYEATDNIEARLDDLEDGTSVDPITVTDTTQSTSKDTGAIITEGGIGVEKNIGLGGDLKLEKEVSHTISVTATTTLNTAGADLSIASGNGNGSGNGGTLNLTSGASTSGDSGPILAATSRALGGNSGGITFQTGLDATDGGDITFKPNENVVVTVSNNTVTMAASTVTKFPDGTVGALPVQFGADGNNGFYGVSDTQLGIAVEGVLVGGANTTGLFTDVISEQTATVGVTVDGVLLKDGTVTASAGFNDQVGTTYLLAASDNGKVVTLNNGGAITLTLPVLAVGFNCSIVQKGAGQVSMVVSGTTLRNRQSHTKLAGQYATASLIVPVTAEWYLSGDTAI